MKRRTDDSIILQMLEDGKQQKEIAAFFGVSAAAICKRVKRLHPPESKALNKLSAKEQKFAIAISEGKTQTEAAMSSFDVTTRDSAKSIGCRLMKQVDIQIAVSEIMQQQGLTRGYRVYKLKQHIDNPDPTVSLRGLDQSWRLDAAYVDRVVVEKSPTYAEMLQESNEIKKEQISLLRDLGKDRQADLLEQLLKLAQEEIINVEPEEGD